MYRIGEKVYWIANVKGVFYEKAGIIHAVVPPYKDPSKYVGDYKFYGRGKPRDVLSFLVRAPFSDNLYWPDTEHLADLPNNKWYLLYTSETANVKPKIPQGGGDRNKIRDLCILFNALYGDVWHENDKYIIVPAWGKRFTFSVADGMECLTKVEEFKPWNPKL